MASEIKSSSGKDDIVVTTGYTGEESPSKEDLRNRGESWDLNYPDPDYERKSDGPEDSAVDKASNLGDDSPYEEVRAAVPNYDDDDLPANTIRAWTLGMILSVVGAAANTLFSMRQPQISIGTIVAQLLAYFAGNLWARVLPNRQFTTFGIKWNLNPGPFNVKEHTVIVVMASVSYGIAYATDVLLAQMAFYHQNFGWGFQLLVIITTQMVGYGIAGMMRSFLVYPAAMIWPANLVNTTLLHAMHEKNKPRDPTVIGGNMSRFKWFGVVFLVSFVYYWLPGFLMQFLSVFAFMTWIFPNNPVINQVFGGTTGLSVLPITFDWTQITGFIGDPLIPPFHAIANTMIGIVVFYVGGSAILHYKKAWFGEFLPISDSNTYDNTAMFYNTTRILTPQLTLNETEYLNYSPIFISTTFAISYGLSFATIMSLVVYTFLHYRKQIWRQFKASRTEDDDIHMKLMRRYPEVPNWWYLALFVIMVTLSLATILHWPTELPWWAYLLAVGFSTFMTLPIGIIQAITNQQIGLNVITEFLFGYMKPGRPVALMLFKTYGYITMSQGLGFVGDLKLGHYMKIPPKTMFMCQTVATIVASIVQIAVMNFALDNIEDVCTQDQKQKFSCPNARVFFSASVIWGLIGPQRVFSPGQIYSALLWGFPLGFAIPVIFWLIQKRWPNSIFKYALPPVILGGGGLIPPATPLNYLSWGMVGYVFQHVIRRKHWRWWSRLNYITASGLDTGLAISTLVIFFAFTLNSIPAPNWWGNTVSGTTMDSLDTAVQVTLGPGQTFGPTTWH